MNRIEIIHIDGSTSYEYVEDVDVIEIKPIIDYDFEVNRLIRQRYTASNELAIHRQRFDKPDEYQQYYEYCEQCKAQAKELTSGTI